MDWKEFIIEILKVTLPFVTIYFGYRLGKKSEKKQRTLQNYISLYKSFFKPFFKEYTEGNLWIYGCLDEDNGRYFDKMIELIIKYPTAFPDNCLAKIFKLEDLQLKKDHMGNTFDIEDDDWEEYYVLEKEQCQIFLELLPIIFEEYKNIAKHLQLKVRNTYPFPKEYYSQKSNMKNTKEEY